MKTKILKRITAVVLTVSMTAALTGCGTNSGEPTGSAGNNEVSTITLYPFDANLTSGVVGGYMGEFLAAQSLNVEVWAYSEEKTNAILASGDLPDIMYVNADNLKTMIDADMVLQLDDYINQMPHVVEQNKVLAPAFDYIRKFRSNDTGNVYAMPTCVGAMGEDGSTDRNVIKLNWEIYEEIGAPEIKNYDDFVSVLKQMMEAHPEDPKGSKIYGMVLNSGSDGTYWGNMLLWMRWNGYAEHQLPYLVESDMIGGKFSSILEDNSMYYQGLKFYYNAMKAGVVNPDSINIDRPAAGNMVKMGGGGTQPGWHDTYFEYLIPGNKVYYNPNTLYGDTTFGNADKFIVINANTEKIDACLKMLDTLTDPDAQILKTMGPEGDYWYTTEDNHLYLTDKAHEHLKSGAIEYFYDSGEKATMWNTDFVLNSGAVTSYLGKDERPVVSSHSSWNEELEYKENTPTYNKWKKTMGYESWMDLLEGENAIVRESAIDQLGSFLSTPDDTMQLTIDAIRDTVVEASWKMVYAADEQEFDEIWKGMVSNCNGLGAQDVLDWRMNDIKNAEQIRDSIIK